MSEEPDFKPNVPIHLSGQSGIRPSSALKSYEIWMKKKRREFDRLRLGAIEYLRAHGKDEWADEIEMTHYQQQEVRREYELLDK
jgi:hypothetical protein